MRNRKFHLIFFFQRRIETVITLSFQGSKMLSYRGCRFINISNYRWFICEKKGAFEAGYKNNPFLLLEVAAIIGDTLFYAGNCVLDFIIFLLIANDPF